MKKLDDAAGKAGAKASVMLDKPHQAMLDNSEDLQRHRFRQDLHRGSESRLMPRPWRCYPTTSRTARMATCCLGRKDALPIVKGHQADINAM